VGKRARKVKYGENFNVKKFRNAFNAFKNMSSSTTEVGEAFIALEEHH